METLLTFENLNFIMKLVRVIARSVKEKRNVEKILKTKSIVSYDIISGKGIHKFEIVTTDEETGPLIGRLKKLGFGKSFKESIIVLGIRASIPKRRSKEFTPLLSREEIESDIKMGGGLNWVYISFLTLASIIVALGMIGDNVIVVIGGMVIAPLLIPMIGSSYHLLNRCGIRPLREAMISETWGIFLAIFWGMVIGGIISNIQTNPLIIGRSVVSFFDVGIAIFAGAAGTLSVATRNLGEFSGVAIAVALVPPAVTVGIGIAMGSIAIVVGAGILTLINIVCVHFSSMITFATLGYTSQSSLKK